MFAVTVELLTGRYVATAFNDRARPEWPPHPARLFSAAVAAWADHGDEDLGERAALEWWEHLAPPRISCSLGDDGRAQRTVVTHFVPDNDVTVLARDTRNTYLDLVSALATAASPRLSARDRLKAEKSVARSLSKSEADSTKAASIGLAPLDRMAILPSQRTKQGRYYPTIAPQDPVVTYYWEPPAGQEVQTAARLKTLDGLLARVARLGHSSSPVSVAVRTEVDLKTVPVTLEPGDGPRSAGLRVPTEGQLAGLIRAFEESEHGTEPRTMPARIQRYRQPHESDDRPRSSIGTSWILLQPSGESRLTVRDIPGVAHALRGALMSVAGAGGGPIPEVISGHTGREGTDSRPTTSPHLMVLGLPFVGHPHATGEVLGIAVVLPQSDEGTVDAGNWAIVTGTVDKFIKERGGRLVFGKSRPPLQLEHVNPEELPNSLQMRRWMRPARTWGTATPIALPRNPGRLGHGDARKCDEAEANAQRGVADACVHIGLPRPIKVEIMLDPPVKGTRPVWTFPPARTGQLTRVQVHAHITFAEPVAGPIVLGAGRFQGLGLCVPLDDETGKGKTKRSAS